jgi:hypothetical protein
MEWVPPKDNSQVSGTPNISFRNMKTKYTQLYVYLLFCSVGIVTGYRLDWGSIPGRARFFLYSTASRPTLRPTHPAVEWVLGAFPPGLKLLESEADHGPPSGSEIKTGGSIPLWHSA